MKKDSRFLSYLEKYNNIFHMNYIVDEKTMSPIIVCKSKSCDFEIKISIANIEILDYECDLSSGLEIKIEEALKPFFRDKTIDFILHGKN